MSKGSETEKKWKVYTDQSLRTVKIEFFSEGLEREGK